MISAASTKQLCHALKEWAIAIEALETGKIIILLRKGGIKEKGGHFQAKHRQVWLYPTYEHQKPQLLKPEFAAEVQPVESGWHPKTVRIGSYAEITEVLALSDRDRVKALHDYHIWNEQMVKERLDWKGERPLFVLLLRVYRLAQPQIIPFDKAYRGCRSWIDLVQSLSLKELTPVFNDDEYEQKVREITNIVKVKSQKSKVKTKMPNL
ncbi:DUF1802 family protein [Myxosarcina sp. GI1]|uniref:DUF1802 family protein n=1 Tax=Myxosarcina sp. GI1 TaxID=1541065 RepID=UPI000690E3B9|nr:DUF1802 family protein [Myxosarcina sp. GI1]